MSFTVSYFLIYEILQFFVAKNAVIDDKRDRYSGGSNLLAPFCCLLRKETLRHFLLLLLGVLSKHP